MESGASAGNMSIPAPIPEVRTHEFSAGSTCGQPLIRRRIASRERRKERCPSISEKMAGLPVLMTMGPEIILPFRAVAATAPQYRHGLLLVSTPVA